MASPKSMKSADTRCTTVMATLRARNEAFIKTQFDAEAPRIPTLHTLIVSCMDPRVDPAVVLGLQSGEAFVIRNVGGRVTPATVQMITLLEAIFDARGVPADQHFTLIVMHHTDCGLAQLESRRELLAAHFQIDSTAIPEKAVTDPHAAVAVDVALLRANPTLRQHWDIYGMVYNVATGAAETVVGSAAGAC